MKQRSNEAPPKMKKVKEMKTRNITLILAVAAAAASTNLRAAEHFLSPRAMDNRTLMSIDGVTEDRLPRGLQWGSPKEREVFARPAQTSYVAGGRTEPNTVTRNRDVAASPRALETFSWLASPASVNVAPVVTPASPAK